MARSPSRGRSESVPRHRVDPVPRHAPVPVPRHGSPPVPRHSPAPPASEKPKRTPQRRREIGVAAATFLLLYALVAAWVLSEPDPEPQVTATRTDATTVVVAGELPTKAIRDALFEALTERDDVQVIVSEVTIEVDAPTPPSLDELAAQLLAELDDASAG